MNEKARAYLIEVARRERDEVVYYSDLIKNSDLNYNLNTFGGQRQLKEMLSDISRFENEHKRPMLTSLAVRKVEKDHGFGFYDLAQEFKKGKAIELQKQLWGFEEAKEVRKFWRNEDHYQQFAKLSTVSATDNIGVPFFTSEELAFFKLWQYKAYDRENKEHVAAKNQLMETVWNKSIFLGKKIIDHLDEFQLDGKRYWSQRGWKEEEGVNVQAAIFKPYTWVKVFRNTDKGKDIFFTFGVDAHPTVEAFVYKIDCQATRDSNLSQKQIDYCQSLIPTGAVKNAIPFDELLKMNWEALTDKCVGFVNQYADHYDSIIESVWGSPIPPALYKNCLFKKDKPNGYETMPEFESEFKAVDIDFLAKTEEQMELGDIGEELVKRYEIAYLSRKGLADKAALVDIVPDGLGYDVLSFDDNGNKKYIEVKTTRGNDKVPFYLTHHEIRFMRSKQGQYSIYRVYRYDEENNFGEFFEIKGDVEEQLWMKPASYKVVLKKES